MALIRRFRKCREEIESALPLLSKDLKRYRVAEIQARSAFQATLDVASITIKHLYCAINSSRDENAWPTDARLPARIEVDGMLDNLEPLAQRTAEWQVLMVREREKGHLTSRVAELEQLGILGPHLTTIILKTFRTKDRLGKAAQWNGLLDQLQNEFQTACRSKGDTRRQRIQQNGPDAPNGFGWQGTLMQLSPLRWQLVSFLWSQTDNRAAEEATADAIWGHDHEKSRAALKSLIHQTNEAFLKASIPISVAQSGGYVVMCVQNSQSISPVSN